MNDLIEKKIGSFRKRYFKTPDGLILDGTNGAEIETWLRQALSEVREQTREETLEKIEKYLLEDLEEKAYYAISPDKIRLAFEIFKRTK